MFRLTIVQGLEKTEIYMLLCKYVNIMYIMLNVDVNILIAINDFMTSKVQVLEKLKRFHFKLK